MILNNKIKYRKHILIKLELVIRDKYSRKRDKKPQNPLCFDNLTSVSNDKKRKNRYMEF